MGRINKILLQNLESKGFNQKASKRIVKDLMLNFSMNPLIDFTEMNSKLQVLGWDDIELDYRMWELAKASFEMQKEENNG